MLMSPMNAAVLAMAEQNNDRKSVSFARAHSLMWMYSPKTYLRGL